jgi:hypothetical protein
LSLNSILIAMLRGLNALMLMALAGVLALHPTPLLARESVRHLAAGSLGSGTRHARAKRLLARHQGLGAMLLFAAVLAVTFVPDPTVSILPLGNPPSAESYLQTLWQVLAAVLGISIVLVAFVLEGFMSKGERRHGGTLLEFASDTGVLFAIDLAAASLVTVRIVLLGNLRDAPAGWAGDAPRRTGRVADHGADRVRASPGPAGPSVRKGQTRCRHDSCGALLGVSRRDRKRPGPVGRSNRIGPTVRDRSQRSRAF